MAIPHVILLIINIVGGIAVLGSYIFGLQAQIGGARALWGNVPENIRPVYGISMIISALGYFAFLYFILFKLVPEDVTIAGKIGFSLFYWIFLAMLIPSALWMPLTNVYLSNPGTGIWLLVRTVLAIVGLASIALVWALLTLNIKTPEIPYWLAVGGSCYFAFHTAILDTILWAAMFRGSPY